MLHVRLRFSQSPAHPNGFNVFHYFFQCDCLIQEKNCMDAGEYWSKINPFKLNYSSIFTLLNANVCYRDN